MNLYNLCWQAHWILGLFQAIWHSSAQKQSQPLVNACKKQKRCPNSCVSGQKGAEWQCHRNFFIPLEGCDEGELLGEETGLQLLWLDYSWWEMPTGQENVSVHRQNLCANLKKRPWEDWYGSHGGTHQCKMFWGLSPKYHSEPWTMDAEDQRHVSLPQSRERNRFWHFHLV